MGVHANLEDGHGASNPRCASGLKLRRPFVANALAGAIGALRSFRYPREQAGDERAIQIIAATALNMHSEIGRNVQPAR